MLLNFKITIFCCSSKDKKMNTQDNNINIFALTDCHQETRKLCCLFSGIIDVAPHNGKNTLICDCGDLFKGIYDRNTCVQSYLTLRQSLPEAKIVVAVGNNDFGFNAEDLNFLKQTVRTFNQANIHVLCANLINTKTGKTPDWVDPYILLEINRKKVMVVSFCINQINLRKYGLRLIDICESFLALKDVIKHIQPDALLVLNHALLSSSLALYDAAKSTGIDVDLIIGGHEHSIVPPDESRRIYYPQAYSRSMLQFVISFDEAGKHFKFLGETSCKSCLIEPQFDQNLAIYEQSCGLNVPVAPSVLNLERSYAEPSPIGSFITDQMRAAAKADIAMISTGFICHALRYDAGKILTHYNIERAFSAETPLQTVLLHASELKDALNNAVRYRYILGTGNTYFLQCSSNMGFDCVKKEDNTGEIKQIYINNCPLLNENGEPIQPEDTFLCAIDPFIGSGEHGFEAFRPLDKETLLKNNRLVKIKDLFIQGIQQAPSKYTAGSSYPAFKLRDIKEN